ncbi:MAG: pyridoxamine 5'-phosphate oxidase family protein [Leptospirales bacterium]
MGKQFNKLEEKHKKFISEQKIFFVATSPKGGKINLSPKGMDTFRVINSNKVAWLNFTGSGNETAAHLFEDDRITVMFCSFDQKPLILRLYGKGQTVHPRDSGWQELLKLFPPERGARQIISIDVDMVQTSCGYSVPFYEYKGERNRLLEWFEAKSDDEIHSYWEEKNTLSLDNKPTYVLRPPK